MSAEIINLATIRADRRDQAEKREEAFLRQEASGFSESLQATVERSRLNLPMMATLLIAKAVDALEDNQPVARTEQAEYDAAATILRAIVKARTAARARAAADAVRVFNMPNGA
jgi:hypothetical protein